MEADHQAQVAASKLDTSPPQGQSEPREPPSKEEILAIAQAAVKSLQDTIQKKTGSQDVDEETKTEIAKNETCDTRLDRLKLTEIPAELTDVLKQGATRVTFAHNRLTGIDTLSKGFADCRTLKYLVLRSNLLTEFPKACYCLPNLELLDLKRNAIESLPEDLNRLTGLRVLSVARNKIRQLPGCIGRMPVLTQLATKNNPIEFPPREVFALDDENFESEKKKDMAETESIKKYLRKYFAQEPNRARVKGLDNESKSSASSESFKDAREDAPDTPRPTRRRTGGGRFPIRPSVSGAENSSDPIVSSPRLPKPSAMLSKPYYRAEETLNSTVRPGVAPVVTNNLSERNRSQSESLMGTSVREKRMGIIKKKDVSNQEKGDLVTSNRLSHLRGLSHGSALTNSAVPHASDSSGPPSPVDGDLQRATGTRRLSALPENQRKSRIHDPQVELARKLVYSLKQVYTPLRDMIKMPRDDGAQQNSVERTFYNACSFLEKLQERLAKLESGEENNEDVIGGDSAASINDSCIACIRTFQPLAAVLKKNLRTLILHSDPQVVRTVMHVLYASLIEVRNACLKLTDVDLVPMKGDEYREANRGRHSPSSQKRPVTSLRVRAPQTSINARGHARGTRQPSLGKHHGAFSESNRNTSNVSLGSNASRSIDQSSTYGVTNAAMSRINTFAAYEDSETQLFDRILHKLNAAADLAVEALPSCMTMLSNARNFASGKPDGTEMNSYDVLIDRCKHVRDAADTLKKRLRMFHSRDPPSSSSSEFWSTVTVFTREHLVFAGNIRDYSKVNASFPLEIRALLKPMHGLIKDIGSTVSKSPWAHMAATHAQQPKSYQQSFSSSQSHNPTSSIPGSPTPTPQLSFQSNPNYQPTLTLQTKSPMLPPSQPDPTSAVSSNGNSAVSSGHVTPIPATPMSAALGPAALATVPAMPEIPTLVPSLGAGYIANGSITGSSATQPPAASTIERSRSVSQRR